jgi:hypothetical protein
MYEDGVAVSYEMQQARPHVSERVSVAVTCIRKVPAPSIGRNTGKLKIFRGFSQLLQTNTLMMMMMMMIMMMMMMMMMMMVMMTTTTTNNKFVIIWKDMIMA